jgi:hypothetical protein
LAVWARPRVAGGVLSAVDHLEVVDDTLTPCAGSIVAVPARRTVPGGAAFAIRASAVEWSWSSAVDP